MIPIVAWTRQANETNKMYGATSDSNSDSQQLEQFLNVKDGISIDDGTPLFVTDDCAPKKILLSHDSLTRQRNKGVIFNTANALLGASMFSMP